MSGNHSTLTQKRLREVLKYCPATGLFSWLIDVSSTGRMGEVAGCKTRAGYIVIRIDGKLHLAHRLAYLYIYGVWPDRLVDHKNGVKSDNRLDNIRGASRSQNGQNTRSAWGHNKASGFLGVHWSEQCGAWRAKVNHQGRQYHAGTFDTPEEAHEAYVAKKRQLHEFCMI